MGFSISEIGDKVAALFTSNEKILAAIEKQNKAEADYAKANESAIALQKKLDEVQAENKSFGAIIAAKSEEINSLKDQLKAAQESIQTESAKAVAKVMADLAIPAAKDNSKAEGNDQKPALKGYARLIAATEADLAKIGKQ